MIVPWLDVDAAFAEMAALSRQMDALLGRRGLDGLHGLRGTAWRGPELERTDAGYRWVADLPGVAQGDLSIQVENGALTLEAKRSVGVPDGWSARYVERGAFDGHRAIRLPDDVDTDGITAALTDGVLTVTLPRRAGTGPRTVAVQS
jgi:HSP20 family protein